MVYTDATPDLSGPSHVRYSIARTVGDVDVRVDIEDDSPMLRGVHENYKTAPKPSSSLFVRWPIPPGCYPDQSYTMTIKGPGTSVPFVARNYDYRFNTPFSMRIASHFGIPPTYESGLVYAIVRVYSPDIAALRLVVNDRVVDETAVRNPTEIVVGLVARSELTTTNVRVQSIDAHGLLLGDETPFRPYGAGTDPPANVVDCF